MLAERLSGLLPPLQLDDMLKVASIASVAGDARASSPTVLPPFRAPHHTSSAQALVGGGSRPRPGEISLAHQGVLFLDELPEFSRDALEALREPLETGVARISRVHEQLAFPAEFQLIAAMNPCPCGYRGDGTDRCNCSPHKLEHYRERISGPAPRSIRFAYRGAARELRGHRAERRPLASRQRCARKWKPRATLQLARRGKLNARLDTRALWRCVESRRRGAGTAQARGRSLAAFRAQLRARGEGRAYDRRSCRQRRSRCASTLPRPCSCAAAIARPDGGRGFEVIIPRLSGRGRTLRQARLAVLRQLHARDRHPDGRCSRPVFPRAHDRDRYAGPIHPRGPRGPSGDRRAHPARRARRLDGRRRSCTLCLQRLRRRRSQP